MESASNIENCATCTKQIKGRKPQVITYIQCKKVIHRACLPGKGLPAYTYVLMKNRKEPFNLKCGACSIGIFPSLPPEVENLNIQLGGGNLHLPPTTHHLNPQLGGGNELRLAANQTTRPDGSNKEYTATTNFTSSPMEPGGPLDSEHGAPMIISPIETVPTSIGCAVCVFTPIEPYGIPSLAALIMPI